MTQNTRNSTHAGNCRTYSSFGTGEIELSSICPLLYLFYLSVFSCVEVVTITWGEIYSVDKSFRIWLSCGIQGLTMKIASSLHNATNESKLMDITSKSIHIIVYCFCFICNKTWSWETKTKLVFESSLVFFQIKTSPMRLLKINNFF